MAAPRSAPIVPLTRHEDDADALAERLHQLCRRLDLRPGERVGTERGLAEHFGVARSRLRVAVQVLEQRGVVVRNMGRNGGIFFSDGRIERQLDGLLDTHDQLRRQGLRGEVSVLARGLTPATAAEARALRTTPGATVLRIDRAWSVGGAPWLAERIVLPAGRLPGIANEPRLDALYGVLRDRYDITVTSVEESVTWGGHATHRRARRRRPGHRDRDRAHRQRRRPHARRAQPPGAARRPHAPALPRDRQPLEARLRALGGPRTPGVTRSSPRSRRP